MKMKIFTCTIVVGSMLGSIAFGQTLTISGSVCQCSKTQVTIQEGTHYWIVQRTRDTTITGTCAPGSTVNVQCKSPDAQRKEGSCQGSSSPTPTPSSGSTKP